MTGRDLPASSTEHPRTRLLRVMRPIAARIMRLRWTVAVHDADLVPPTGGVILAANHIGLVDGPLLATYAPRPVHALTKREMFDGTVGAFLRGTGQIPRPPCRGPGSDPHQPAGRPGRGVLGIFPEGTRGGGDLRRFHHGASYLALVTGAPVVPVTLLGTRAPGSRTSVPASGEHIDVVFGRAWQTTQQPWPRTREQVAATSVLLRGHMLSELDRALSRTRRSLPGPLPAGQSEDDPDTGLVEPSTEL